jgi:hypothetical protein
MTQSLNPLRAFFRQPAIYIRLPSDGQFWPPGSIDMPVNRELPILPMTAIDEITYRTPDALFNGAAIVSVVQSCIPSIKNAWQMPNCDLNTILTAIRIASYGAMMAVDTTCEKCSTENNFELDLEADEGYRVLKYGGGAEYTAHHDHFNTNNRVLSLVAFLNDGYSGGNLIFPRFDVSIKPKAGTVIVFPSNFPYIHIAEPVGSNDNSIKYSLVTWFR